ncbi:MAG: helix-turn-helix transcriptional regulator [Candidatus Marinimicrobia bacterium]|nr:helix-turn-helix transcriptional regulator [Candidatus Neomarinimicrobiota bacterium]MBL7010613.1 helix-turn-helix transcriptional regulator [Candidatus Neomarinimicrobiota bacterium]MBL7030098.1 helix-turn-helix transcriptional regulator [Candidatus Neomarinimicrobiota bacterium]
MNNQTSRSCIRSYVDSDKLIGLSEDISQQKDLNKITDVLAMFANPTRMKILYCLSQTNELCVCDLSDILQMEVSAISHQLRKLKDRRLVKNRREGLTIYYSISSNSLAKKACEYMEKILSTNFQEFPAP